MGSMGKVPVAANTRLIGRYVWEIAADILWGDRHLAELLGLTDEDVNAGFSILRFMKMVHPDDQSRVAKGIKRDVLTGMPYNASYRLVRNGETFTVTDSGACFRYRDGLPSLASGTLAVVEGV